MAKNPIIVPVQYGNGVYYFGLTGMVGFGPSIAEFKKNNPDLMITAIAPDDTGGFGYGFGYTIGYWVNTEPRK